ncbi:MAG: ADP-ribosylglycohydrolase family protein [Gemmatimonadales bacterium]|nr:ADP-ribosylglycohydrolase family protein [Gemmatimonadales bacterium]
MRKPPFTPTSRARGALLGAATGWALTGAARGEPALTRALAEELAEGKTDLRQLALRWVELYLAEPESVSPETAAALDHLARHHAPPEAPVGQGSEPIARCLPVALAAAGSPRTLVSATYHIAALTHPEPRVAWAAVAVNLAAGRFLLGKRDFVADVIEALRANAAPEVLVEAARRVPVERRDAIPALSAMAGDAVACAEVALWLAYHEPVAERGLRWLAAGGGGGAGAAAAGGLLGARDGVECLPSPAIAGTADADIWCRLADRLAPALATAG